MHSLLLTGATGFIGSYVLAELSRRTDRSILCLVRDSNLAAGRERIRRALQLAGSTLDEDRVETVAGDLALDRFGMSEGEFDALAERVGSIYHCGALVNFARPYPMLKAANVGGTREILRLACRGRSARPVHHCSTLRVFASTTAAGAPREIDEYTPLGGAERLHTGYSQSKWVAEQLVNQARERGVPISVYRPGMVTGDRETGHSNLTDLLSRLIKGCIQMERTFAADIPIDLTPVDFVAAAMVALSLRREHIGGTFHLVAREPVPFSRVARWIRELGYTMDELPYATWRDALMQEARKNPEHALAPLLSFFVPDMDRHVPPLFTCPRTTEALRGSGVTCPAADRGLLRIYIDRYVRDGFLPPPPAAAARRTTEYAS